MRKFFFISFIITLLFVYTDSKSQDISCPIGWSSGWLSSSITNPNNNQVCYIDIYYCWMIDENGQISVRLRAVIFLDRTKLTGLDLASPEFWNIFNDLIINDLKNNPSLQLPPCPSTTIVISLQRVNCWHLQDLDVMFSTTNGYVNPNHSYLGLTPCDIWGAYCNTIYTVCWDYTVTPPELSVTPNNPPPVGVVCPGSFVPFDPTAPISTDCFSTCF